MHNTIHYLPLPIFAKTVPPYNTIKIFVFICPLVLVECLVSDGKLEAGDLERRTNPDILFLSPTASHSISTSAKHAT